MASGNQKEFELAFKLSAQVNGSLNSAFKGAQSSLANMQKQIQALNKAQGDISAYQKQQQAVETTKKKLEVLQQQYDNIQKEIKETGSYSSDLENKLLSKQQQIDKTKASLEQQTQKLNENGEALRKAGVDTNNLTSESQRLEAEMKDLKQQQEEAADGAQNFGESGSEAMQAVAAAIAAAGVAAALKEIAEAYMECIRVAGDFEETLSTVEALSGASAQEMGQLSELAKKMGAETQFTAQESAEAMTYMGMAGWEAQDMLSGLDGVMQLAAASGEDLAMVSDIVTDSLTALNLTAADSAHFSDVLAAAATSSNTNVSLMGETFKYAASMAGTLGYSAEDVAVAIGLMANSGIKGSMAGTALNSIFTRLSTNTKKSRDAIEALGVEFYNADGSARDFGDVMDELRIATANMTDVQKTAFANTVAGMNAQKGFLTILNASEADYKKLTNSINNCNGAASRMAAIKLDNMNGQLKLAQSAWEGVTIAVGEQFTPAMSGLYKVGAKVFGQMKEFIEQNPALVKAVTAFIAVIGIATAGLTAYAAIVKVVEALNLAALFTGPAGAIMLAVAGVAALTGAIIGFIEADHQAVPTVDMLTEAAQNWNAAMDEAKKTQEEANTTIGATASVAGQYIDRLEEIEAATGGNVEGNIEYQNILELLVRTVPELSEQINLETHSIEGGTAALREHIDAWKEDAEAQARQEYLNGLYDEAAAVRTEAAENSIKLTAAQMKERTVTKQLEDAQARMNKMWEEAAVEAERQNREYGILVSAGDVLGQEYYDLQNEITQYTQDLYDCQRTQKNLTQAIEEDNKAVAEAEATINEAEAAIKEMTAEEQAAADAQAAIQEQVNMFNNTIAETIAVIDELAEAYDEAYKAAFDSINGQYALWDSAAEVAAKDVTDINAALESQSQYWQQYNDNLKSLSERTGEIQGLSAVIASFADGSQESVNAIAGMASASDADLKEMVANWQEVQREQDETASSIAELKTNFTTTMDELGLELKADVEAMDMGAESKEAARKTIQAYIDQAAGMESQVRAAYEKVANAAKSALASIPSTAGATGGGSSGGGSSGGGSSSGNGYASGTNSAEPGWAMVGEQGPEMMFMNGGEKVLTAAETARAKEELSSSNAAMQAESAGGGAKEAAAAGGGISGGITINNSPTIVVNGNQPGDLEAKLEANNQSLLQQIEAKLSGYSNERRTAYA